MSVSQNGFFRHGNANFAYFGVESEPEPCVGIFMKGGCEVLGISAAAPLIRNDMSGGSFAIFYEGIGIADGRPDILLQSRRNLPAEALHDVVASDGTDGDADASMPVKLPLDYFRPVLFEPTFAAPGFEQFGRFAKRLVVLATSAAVTRSIYRHRHHGYLVDPGGFWLNQSLEKRLNSVEGARWFASRFENVGRMEVVDFYETFGEVVRLVKAETGAPVLALNTLVVDTANPIHNYQFSNNSQALRRREFDLALRDLSRKLDFYVLDVDKALKTADFTKQYDFFEFPSEYLKPIAHEAHRILRELEIV
jgi:hypothetical protein